MATLAAMLNVRGDDVQGSDQAVYPPMSDFLAREGLRVFEGYDAAHVTPEVDEVVVGNAISRGNPELEAVLDRKIRYRSLPETIRERFLWQSRSLVIAGTHGKTTTTGLVGWLLTAAGRDPSVLAGGMLRNFDSSFRLGSGREFVIEGDEYDSAFFDKTAKFLKYLPDIVVVGNVEYDHADIYPDMDALRLAFRRLVTLIPRQGRLVLGADSPEALGLADLARCPVETVGLAEGANWRATDVRPDAGRIEFQVTHDGRALDRFSLPMYGRHNVRNALAALAVGHAVGLDPEEMRRGLATFEGVRRRLEQRGVAGGVTVFDDFAHHPSAIFETLSAVRAAHPDRRIWALFEPRSATSCRRVFQDAFVSAFADAGADEVVLAPVFRTSLAADERLDVDALVRAIGQTGTRARQAPDAEAIAQLVAHEAQEGDLVVVMSNGGFDRIHERLLSKLAALGRAS